ncbi:hypothetical protein Stsp01_66750 [Streptomyces sp. NBRC 13847]|nr:hypothetical protein Stsp01_66750 [Streptomyces sp. NBRC 13847]
MQGGREKKASLPDPGGRLDQLRAEWDWHPAAARADGQGLAVGQRE